jgi:predicted nucleotidyltransferase
MAGVESQDSRQSNVTSKGVAMEPPLREIVERIVQEVHPTWIMLFGSVARDEQSIESDVDFLVVMPEGTHKRQTAQMLYRKLRGLPVPVDILVTTEADRERQKDNPGLIYRTILQEGRELYAA